MIIVLVIQFKFRVISIMKHSSIVVISEYLYIFQDITLFLHVSATFFNRSKKKRLVSTIKIAIANRIKFSTKLYEWQLKKIRSSFITRQMISVTTKG